MNSVVGKFVFRLMLWPWTVRVRDGNKIHECKINDAGNNCTSLMLSAKYELQTDCDFKCHIFKHLGESHKPVKNI